jgi:hypothetical protein
MVDRSELLGANALLATALNLQVVAGSALGGVLVAWIGTQGALAANALSFLVSAFLVSLLPPLIGHITGESRSFAVDLREGLRFSLRHRVTRAVIVTLFLAVTFAAIDNVVLVFFARESIGVGPLGFGLLSASFGVGMIAVSLALARGQRHGSAASLFVAGMAVNGGGMLLTGVAPAFGFAVACQLLAGAGNGGQNVASDTLIQQTVPRAMLGRVFGLAGTASVAGGSLAALLGGILLGVASPRAVLAVAGAVVLLVASFAYVSVRTEDVS